jgi:hypothetical protein
VFGVGGGLRHLAEQNGMKLHVLFRLKDQDFGSDDDMGSAVLNIDFERVLDVSSNVQEVWLAIQEPVPDSESDEESEPSALRGSSRSIGGEILLAYKLKSFSSEEDPEAFALGLLDQLEKSGKSLDSSDDEADELDSAAREVSNVMIKRMALKPSQRVATGSPKTREAVAAPAATASSMAVPTETTTASIAESGVRPTSAESAYDPGARHWWYVASDEARSVMGGYTGLEMAGWLAGGYFTKDLVVFYQGVPRVEWAKLHEMYTHNMSKAFLVAPKKGDGLAAADGRDGGAKTDELSVQQEIIRDTTFADDVLAASGEKGSVLFSAYSEDSKFWIITDTTKQPVRMTIAEMRAGVKQGTLVENMHTVPVGQQEWKPLSAFY